jgi:CHAT domain
VKVRIELVPDGDAWMVRVLEAGGRAELAPGRRLRRLGAAPWGLPLPPEAEATALAAAAPHRSVCNARDDAPLRELLGRLFGRAARRGDIETAGRYLFAVLLGEAAWEEIRPAPGGRLDIELVLPTGDPGAHRLPWEMLHDGTGFLAMSRGINLLRRVDSPALVAPVPPLEATSPLTLLVVVGTGLSDDAIRPAAEYLGLIQNLKAYGLDRRLRPHLLLEATSERLEAAVAAYRPAVVHVIAHGRMTTAGPQIELRQQAGGPSRMSAATLAGLLGNPAPVAVVLSVCHTAETGGAPGGLGEPAASFAGELVAHGVPLVVGMGGRVSDLACRLFTRAFYAALLGEGDLIQAAAEGRRAASLHGEYQPGDAVDWALPAVFVAEGVTPFLTLTPAPLEQERAALADALAPGRYPPFCDRFSVLAKGDLLLAGPEAQKRLGSEFQVLALRTGEHEKIGSTWALRALAARAAIDGHLPLLVARDVFDLEGDLPSTWSRFIDLLELSIEYALRRLGLQAGPCAWSRWLLGQRMGPPPGPVPERQLEEGDLTGQFRRALRIDLLEVLAAVRAHPGPGNRTDVKLLLLVDDVHRMGNLAARFLEALGPFGLLEHSKDVRIVFVTADGCSTVGDFNAYQTAIKKINDWLGNASWARSEPLKGFSDGEERLAYRHFLLHFERQGIPFPLAPARAADDDPDVDRFFRTLGKRVQGLPSRLAREAESLIDTCLDLFDDPVLGDPRDEEVIALWAREGVPW